MHVAVLPPNGSKQSPYSCDDLRACVMHRCTHFDFPGMNLPKVLAAFDAHRYSAGVGCARAGLETSPMVAAVTMARNGARSVAIMTSPSTSDGGRRNYPANGDDFCRAPA
jgi:hypothetical protein